MLFGYSPLELKPNQVSPDHFTGFAGRGVSKHVVHSIYSEREGETEREGERKREKESERERERNTERERDVSLPVAALGIG